MENVTIKGVMQKPKEASLTVEASLVVPVFLFAVIFFLYFFQFLSVMDSVQSGITEAGRFISRYAPVAEEGTLSETFKIILLKQKFYEYLDEGSINANCIVGGVYGITVTLTGEKEDSNELQIMAAYSFRFPIPFFGEKTSLVTQKVKTRTFVGQEMKKNRGQKKEVDENSELDDLLVYVTEHGSVYHTSESCTHLQFSISEITISQIKSARNHNGGKYKACEKCVKNKNMEESVYITNDGEHYHNSLSCSGLKRTVYAVPYLEVIGKRKCSRCG